MKIDVTKIEGYENMTAEEKLAALENFDIEEKPNDESKWKSALDKATAEAAKYKKELREKQTESERLEAERAEKDKAREEMLASLMKEKALAEQKSNFLKVGYSEELADNSAKAIVDGDYKTVFANLGTFISERDKKKEAELLDKTKRPNGGSGTSTVTKEQFDKMSFSERNNLYNDNPDLYHELKGE